METKTNLCTPKTRLGPDDPGVEPSSRPRRHRLGRVAAVLALGSGLMLGSALVDTTPASAAGVGRAYVVVGNGNCIGGGRVTGVFGAVDNQWSGGDWGDNIVYPSVQIGRRNVFNGRAYCDRPWFDPRGDYWVNVVWKEFTPTRTNQTFWF